MSVDTSSTARSPLLTPTQHSSSSHNISTLTLFSNSDSDEHSPQDAIPWSLLLPLMMYRMTDAIGYTLVFPFMTDMITSFHAPSDRIGLYAGLAEGILMIVEAVAAPAWAVLADRYGRRPCLLGGTFVAVMPAVAVGFSTKVWHVIMWRALLGLAPASVLGGTAAAEICTRPGQQTKVFALFSPTFSFGAMIGTALGGELARPYGRLPSCLGGSNEFLRVWPYALPCIGYGSIGLFTTVLGFFRLVETRPPHDRNTNDAEWENDQEPQAEKVSYVAALKVPHFMLITTLFCFYQLNSMSWDAIFPVYTYTPVLRGGLGLSVSTIGIIMSVTALSYILSAPFVLPVLVDKFGRPKVMKGVLILWPILALTIPLAQLAAARARWVMWGIVGVQRVFQICGNFARPMGDMLTMGAFDDYPHLLATGSAISLIVGAFGRAVGPAISGWTYSLSTIYTAGTWGRQLSWIVFVLLNLPAVIIAWFLPNDLGYQEGYHALPLNEGEEGGMSQNGEDNDGGDDVIKTTEGRRRMDAWSMQPYNAAVWLITSIIILLGAMVLCTVCVATQRRWPIEWGWGE